jgi:hypothetical protein
MLTTAGETFSTSGAKERLSSWVEEGTSAGWPDVGAKGDKLHKNRKAPATARMPFHREFETQIT